MLRSIMSLLATLAGLYSILIIIRILLTWFDSPAGSGRFSGPVQFLARLTDPYLDWWRYHFRLQVGILDLSPMLAMAALSVLQVFCSDIARRGRVSPGIMLAVCISMLWSAVSFILGFCIVILVLRLIAFFANSNMYSPFWQVIDTISRSLLYRVNRIIFGSRMVRFTTGIITAIIILAVIWIGGRIGISILIGLLSPLV